MRTPSRVLAVAASIAVALSLGACGDSSEEPGDASSAPAAAQFPVTITHAFGTTTIEAKPERVAAVNWANHEVALALGVVPVGFAKASWGDDDGDGVLPWVKTKLTELGAGTPVLFDETDSIDFEAVADTTPDVILAAYSGLTKEDYDKLSQIAPTVAYPEAAWGTSLADMIKLNSQALGLAAEGDALIASLNKQVADAFAKYPQLAGKKVMFTYLDPKDFSQIGFYTTHDPRAGFLADIGFVTPSAIAKKSAESSAFWETISAEQADQFADVDIVITYDDPQGSILAAAQKDPLMSKIPAIARGSVAGLQDSTPLAASANPSPLSIGWGIDKYFAALAAAADKI
ncbi:iron-siderophore ABC transporter substrate-binding protein [Plantactinospora sp. KBS50]|uniref:iron-siderophore ABC transporter substrate-binding protein n=1 Tax=Plantactinospora sp. KBS50 TaxID=2024580 RepID=UPI000BAAF826|nr:iron-siderophore ABC transporter substrate-binding protein [Plantactinospora sp. KBS50]ASW52933.1 ABC transporter substrate-binding protein [Plantactinospora sp. KBS50]